MTRTQRGVICLLALAAGAFVLHERYEPSAPAAPTATAWYLVSHDLPDIYLWRDEAARTAARAMAKDGTWQKNPKLVASLVSCIVQSGTPVARISDGIFATTVLVEDGPWSGCRGDVPNEFLSNTQAPGEKG